MRSSSITITPYSPEESLGLIVDLGLTKENYMTMRLGAKVGNVILKV